MVWNVIIPAAAALIGGSMASRGAQSAANTQAAAADRASEVQRDIFERQVELSRPYREAGELALNRLIPLATEYTPFGMEQFQADPGYGFRLSERKTDWWTYPAVTSGLVCGNMKSDKPVKRQILDIVWTRVRIPAAPQKMNKRLHK